MDVSSEPDVIGQVPSRVIGIVIDSYVIRIPKPAIRVGNVVRGDRKIKTIEPETIGTASTKTPDMATAKASCEAPMFKWMIEMVASVVSTGIMADPLSVGMHVGSFRMPLPVAEMAILLDWMRISRPCGAVSRNVLAPAANLGVTSAVFLMLLGQR